jgi:hypothetical protein
VEETTPKEVDRLLRQYLRHRSDLGLWNALTGRIFEPLNPFQTRFRRKPQRWFALFVVSSAAAVAALVYFNFVN